MVVGLYILISLALIYEYELNNVMLHDIPISDILLRMLDVNPRTRITMDELMSIL